MHDSAKSGRFCYGKRRFIKETKEDRGQSYYDFYIIDIDTILWIDLYLVLKMHQNDGCWYYCSAYFSVDRFACHIYP